MLGGAADGASAQLTAAGGAGMPEGVFESCVLKTEILLTVLYT